MNLKKYLIVILAVVAVGLAGLLYKQKMQKMEENPTPTPTSTTTSTVPVSTLEPGSEREYLLSIRPDATEDEKRKHYEFAVSIAKESEYLNVTDCNPEPLVLQAKNGSTIKLKNDGDNAVTLMIDSEHKFSVAAKSTESITADFGKGAGLYGYGCNESNGPRGMIYLVP